MTPATFNSLYTPSKNTLQQTSQKKKKKKTLLSILWTETKIFNKMVYIALMHLDDKCFKAIKGDTGTRLFRRL
jgi:hypothetical protein